MRRNWGRCFGTEALKELVRREGRSKQAAVGLEVPRRDSPEAVRYEFQVRRERSERDGAPSPTISTSLNLIPGSMTPPFAALISLLQEPGDQEAQHREGRLRELLSFLPSLAIKSLVGPLVPSAYYLPADRTGVMHSHQVVVNALIHNATAGGQRFLHAPDAVRGAGRFPWGAGCDEGRAEQRISGGVGQAAGGDRTERNRQGGYRRHRLPQLFLPAEGLEGGTCR